MRLSTNCGDCFIVPRFCRERRSAFLISSVANNLLENAVYVVRTAHPQVRSSTIHCALGL